MGRGSGNVVSGHFAKGIALPPNKGMQLTVQNVTVLAKRRAVRPGKAGRGGMKYVMTS
jgi:hypothetical protein